MPRSIIPLSNLLIALFSVTALFFVSALAVIVYQLERPLVSILHADIWHIIELEDKKAAERLVKILQADQQIDTASILLWSQDMARDFMKKETGITFELDGVNPFVPILSFSTKPLYFVDLSDLEKQIKQVEGVKYTSIQHEYLKELKQLFASSKHYLLLVLFVILTLSIFLLSGLFRLVLYAERKKIKTMELVGASPFRIASSFLLRFGFLVLGAMLLAGLLLFSLWSFYLSSKQQLMGLYHWQYSLWIVSVWFLISFLLLLLSYRAIARFSSGEYEHL